MTHIEKVKISSAADSEEQKKMSTITDIKEFRTDIKEFRISFGADNEELQVPLCITNTEGLSMSSSVTDTEELR